MSDIVKRVKNKLWRIWNGDQIDGIYSFSELAGDEIAKDYTGKISSIFFKNKDRVVHKWLHYLPIYDTLLADYEGSNVHMLEIGVYKGGSLAMWRKFLGENATIFGIDINPDCAALDTPRESVRIGSQDDPEFLRGVVKEMGGLDIVLDDGSHIGRHQVASFETLWPLLSDGGLYIIEDCHTSYWPSWEGGLRRRGTIIEFFKGKIDQMHKHYIRGENKPEDIASITFFDSIIVIKKLHQLPRCHVKVPSEV